MSLLFISGGAHEPTGTTGLTASKFNSASSINVSTSGPSGNGSYLAPEAFIWPAQGSFWMGGYVLGPPSSAQELLTIRGQDPTSSYTDPLIHIRYNAGSWYLREYATAALIFSDEDGPLVAPITDGVWTHIEVRVEISSSDVTMDLYINNEHIGQLTTGHAGNSMPNPTAYRFGWKGVRFWSNLFIDNGVTRKGDSSVITLWVDGNDSPTDWIPLSGTNYEMVDETRCDQDTTYNSSANVDDEDRFTLQNLPTDGDILGIQVVACVKKTAEGSGNFKLRISDGTNTHDSVDYYPAYNNYRFFRFIVENNPWTGLPWTKSDIDGLRVGIIRTS